MLTAFSGLAKASPGELALSAALALLFAALGYRMSARHRAVRGVTPWRLPSLAWAVVCLFLQFIGLAIEVFAELTTRSPYAPGASARRGGAPGPTGGPAPAAPAPSSPGPPVSTGAFEPPDVSIVPLTPELARAARWPVPAPDKAGRSASFGWYPDPTGRHELRYFDGRRWNEHVLDGGQVSVEPL